MWKYYVISLICLSIQAHISFVEEPNLHDEIKILKRVYTYDIEGAFKKNTDILEKLNEKVNALEEQVKSIIPCQCNSK